MQQCLNQNLEKLITFDIKKRKLLVFFECGEVHFFCRIWKLAAPKAKAKPKAKPKAKAKAAALEPPLELQKAYKTRSAAPGGRASSSWPLMGGRYPLPLFDDAEPECVVGWAMISHSVELWELHEDLQVFQQVKSSLNLLCIGTNR